ncbi:AMP-binding protein [bacterium]|nr:AMP-binding protein [bacterium]
MTAYNDRPWLKCYDDHIPEELPIPDITFLDLIETGLNANPEHTAFHFLGNSCTYRQLNNLSNRFASFLIDKGCVKGDVVGISLPNTPQYLVAIVGTMKAGCVVSGVSPLLTPREMVHQLNDSRAKVLITLDAILQHKLADVADQIPDLKQVIATNIVDFLPGFKQFLAKRLKKVPTGKIVPLKGKEVISYKQLISTFPADKPEVELIPDDTCLLQYTGGTTGPSKGTVLTHRNQVFNSSTFIRWIDKDIDPNLDNLGSKRGRDISCSGFPFFHVAGLFIGLTTLAMGNTQILVPDPRNTDQICKDIKKYGVTQMGNVPTLFQLLNENPLFAEIDFTSLMFCGSGAAPMDDNTLIQLESFIGKGKVVELYGMTETSPLVTMNPQYGMKKLGSVGVPLPNTKIKIMDLVDGNREMPIGEPGELIVCGPQVMKEYYGNPEASQKAFKEINGDRYLYTGDVAKMDEDGFVFIVDRTKDMLLVGGFNVYSKQVEESLYELPEIEICAIVGESNPDRPGSEIVKAVIQLKKAVKDTEEKALKDKITAHCRENLSAYKVPKIIEFMAEIPLTAIGKVDKKALRI